MAKLPGIDIGETVQLTIDSGQDLNEVLRVVGALYGVQLSISAGEATAVAAPAKARGVGRPRKAVGRPPRRVAGSRPAASSALSASDIRAWAQANGHDVNSRGRIPASVVDAYRADH